MFIEYSSRGYDGEIDVLARRDNFYHFYEIKCNYTKRSYEKAEKQYARFKKAYPRLDVKGIYVSRQKVLRLRGDE